MRVLILLLLAAVGAFALGCQESGFDERKETARPLKVQHVKGESKVPGQAERVATLTLDTLDATLALGLRPVAAVVPGDSLPGYLRRPAAGVETIRPLAAGELGALRKAKPDLIVGRQAALFEGLSLIAPTVIVEPGSGRWKLNLRLMGEALGRTNDAEALLTDYDRRVAGARGAVEGRPRVAVVRAVEDGWRFAPRDSFAGTILADLGLRQVGSFARADVVLLSQPESERVDLNVDGRFSQEDVALATWWGPGGAIEARAALADLQEILRR
ncbi:MAG TPA: ABC transporter substrate-binding protein [Thermoleophilaceae bacterium]|nr:ABC transporter substrate-binding protein [Thermoleophilaceae bacterium]